MNRQLHSRARWIAHCCAFAFWLASFGAAAAPPQLITHQGRLLDASGDAISGSVGIKLAIWDSLTGGTLLYEENHPTVSVRDGLYALEIGSGTASVGPIFSSFSEAIFAGSERFLEISLNSETLSPRQRIRSVPYALQSGNADTVDGRHADEFALTSDFATLQTRVTDLEAEVATLRGRVNLLAPCGDGVIDPNRGEECDAGNLGGTDCTTFGFAEGTLACTPTCRFDVSTCSGGCPDIGVGGPLVPQATGVYNSRAVSLELGGPGDDAFQAEFYTNATGSFALTGTNYASCDQCIRVIADLDGTSPIYFFQSGGILTVSLASVPRSGSVSLTLSDVTLIEVTIEPSTFVSTPVPDGACVHIDSLSLSTP